MPIRRHNQVARIFDISQILRPDIPVWPGESPFALHAHASISSTCPVNVGAIFTPLHAGTHADAPLHYDAHGLSMADCALDPYIGPCLLIDVTHAGPVVTTADLNWPDIVGCQRVLLRTYKNFPARAWDNHFKSIAPELIERLAQAGVRLIGTDAASLDPETSKELAAHRAVQKAGMRILEGLVLDEPPPGNYELVALPLKILGGDASPVRAILRELPPND
jgi:arylformamidase